MAQAILKNWKSRKLADNGWNALNLLANAAHEQPIQLVILDWRMPTMDGPATCDHPRRECPNLPVPISTGYSKEQARATFPDFQVVSFLQKPFSAKQMSQAVSQAFPTWRLSVADRA